MSAIETYELTRAFSGRVVVDRLTLTAPRGAMFGFLGPNGAGKTTTVRMLAALIAPTAGGAVVAGYRLGKDDQMIRRSVGLLTESPGLYERLSARQNLVFFARLYDLGAARAEAQTERYLRMLGLWDRRDDPVGSFSKGMRQKLAIAYGKCLASLVPAIIISWSAASIFVLTLRLVALSDQVYRVILSGGWWVILLLGSPSLALIMVAATVAISGRVNDPRTAQQVATVVVVPILALFVAQLLGVVVLTPLLAFVASAVLAFMAALAFAGAVVLFERENILTRWTA
ncbi:MAG: ABC transporter ATP-binding protein [Roseiflexus sp.]|nr:ABC transporter ATP-binding protein [Roseiflexus sp.]